MEAKEGGSKEGGQGVPSMAHTGLDRATSKYYNRHYHPTFLITIPSHSFDARILARLGAPSYQFPPIT
jgi:hypothetical protein